MVLRILKQVLLYSPIVIGVIAYLSPKESCSTLGVDTEVCYAWEKGIDRVIDIAPIAWDKAVDLGKRLDDIGRYHLREGYCKFIDGKAFECNPLSVSILKELAYPSKKGDEQ